MFIPPELLDCECDSCCEGSCSIDLTGRTQDIYVLDLNCVKIRAQIPGRISDCAILWKNRQIFAVIELKGGHTQTNVKQVVDQIQAGIDAIASLTWDQHLHDFYPILMYRGPDPSRALRGKLVKFRGQKRRIIPRSCGSRLRDIPGI